MKLYFAPLEGITKFIYRNVHAEMFGGCDAYFAPFITPSDNEKNGMKALRDILPENNQGIPLKVQVQTNCAESFLKFERKIVPLGYDAVNINLGCPSGTVVKKGRGAGFLQYPEELDAFLEEVFQKSKLRISVKTRTGYASGNEMEQLTKIYNRHPLSLVVIHPRARNDFYNGVPDEAVFAKAYRESVHKICYNGNICKKQEFAYIKAAYPDLDSVMIGRGAIANPAIFREIRGGEPLTTAELQQFTENLIQAYLAELKSEVFTLQKLKEVWMYMMWNYPEEKKILKQIKKSNKLSEFRNAISYLPEISL